MRWLCETIQSCIKGTKPSSAHGSTCSCYFLIIGINGFTFKTLSILQMINRYYSISLILSWINFIEQIFVSYSKEVALSVPSLQNFSWWGSSKFGLHKASMLTGTSQWEQKTSFFLCSRGLPILESQFLNKGSNIIRKMSKCHFLEMEECSYVDIKHLDLKPYLVLNYVSTSLYSVFI